MKGIGEDQNPGWVLKTFEVYMPKGLKALMETIKEILLKGKIQTLSLEVGSPITYSQLVQEGNELLIETTGMTLGDVARNIALDEYQPPSEPESNLGAWNRMWLAIALRNLHVTHIGVGSGTRLWKWLGMDEMVYGGLQQMYGADIVCDKQFTEDVVVLFAGMGVGGRVEAITYGMKCHLLLDEDFVSKENEHGPRFEGQDVGGGNHTGKRGQTDGAVADAADRERRQDPEVRPRKSKGSQGRG